MSTEENVRILQEAYQLWNDSKADSVSHWLDLLADDVCWRSIADGAPGMEFSRECGCKNSVADYFSELAVDWEMIHYTVNEFIAQDDRVVMVGRCGWRHKKTGKEVDTPKVDILQMKDAKIVDFFELYDTAKAYAAVDS